MNGTLISTPAMAGMTAIAATRRVIPPTLRPKADTTQRSGPGLIRSARGISSPWVSRVNIVNLATRRGSERRSARRISVSIRCWRRVVMIIGRFLSPGLATRARGIHPIAGDFDPGYTSNSPLRGQAKGCDPVQTRSLGRSEVKMQTSVMSYPQQGGWEARGACKHSDPELFFPVAARGPALRQLASAKKVCERCPVRVQCLEYALQSGQSFGVWGGASEEERRLMRRRQLRRRRAAALAG
jgi:WhiB family redox-sensing transcriptional regulator